MKNLLFTLVFPAIVLATGCDRNPPDPGSALRAAGTPTYSSFDPASPGEKSFPPHSIDFDQADLAQVLKLYAEISGRSVIRGEDLPDGKFTFSNQTPMRTVEALQALDTVLASHHIVAVAQGAQYVNVVSEGKAREEAGPVVQLPPDQLPDSSSYLVYLVKLRKVPGEKAARALAPFSRFQQSIIYIPAGSGPPPKSIFILPPQIVDKIGARDNVLILRDYSSNVKNMLKVLNALDE
jgi:type II secretory pathway component GspD/PulD (secretin)